MISSYYAKPWLLIGVGYRAGRPVELIEGELHILKDWLATECGTAECFACPELDEKDFRKRHTMARFIRQHRHCGKKGSLPPSETLAKRYHPYIENKGLMAYRNRTR